MKNLFYFALVALLVSACSADVCSNYKAFSTSTTDSFCQDVACRQYCMKGSDVEKCMKFVYEDSFKLCQKDGSEPVPTPPTSSTSSTPIPTTQSSPSTSDPRDCSTWSSDSPSYVEWCKTTGCPTCSSLTGSQFESCLDFYKTYCTFGSHASSTSTSTPPGSGSGPTVCKSWTGVVGVYDDYCQNNACPTCNGYGDEATRQACYQSQVSHCNIPGL